MTNGSNDRLDRIEAIVESNSRAIQALTDDIAELKLVVVQDHEQAREERAELRRAAIGIANRRKLCVLAPSMPSEVLVARRILSAESG